MKYDFSGWATRNDLQCSDGRIIRRDAFKRNDGQTVPLVWNHQHAEPYNVLGHALLENRDEGVYAYCSFNDTEQGQNARLLVEHGDICALSIYANQLKQQGPNVMHGNIREVSLVLASANPGASIQSVIKHGEESDEEAVIFTGEELLLYHADDSEKDDKDESDSDEGETIADVFDTLTEKQKKAVYAIIGMALENKDIKHADDSNEEDDDSDEGETIADVFNTLTEKQKEAVYFIIGEALKGDGESESKNDDGKDSKGGEKDMKHNVFETEDAKDYDVLTHSEQESIINLAKTNSVGSLQEAINIFSSKNGELVHGIDEIEQLFPDYRDVRPGAPEFLQRDQGWVAAVMQKTAKSPISRIRTRQADIRSDELRAYGYQKTKEKKATPNFKLLKRTTDPQTVYRKDALNRDDIVDITDFDVVEYQYRVMRQNLEEEIALAVMIGDGRDDGDESKISEEHIRSIWHDDDLYTIHTDVDFDAAKAELQGTNTGVNFGENYIYAEAIITAALYAREQYKGSGSPDFYCTPHLLNVMLLARDLNGRRIYDSKSDLAAALNVGAIYTAEQFEGKQRTDKDQKKKKLLGIFVNLSDYQIGSTKGGQITRFNQFDIDFNQEKYLIETRVSGALTRVYSAIALEEEVEGD